MAGILNQSKASGEKRLFRLIENGKWEAWAMDDAGKGRLLQEQALPSDEPIPPLSVVALPLRQLFAVPLWLATTDHALMKDMIFLQLERRGLAGGKSVDELVFDFLVVNSSENKTLVLAIVLPGTLPEHLCLAYQRFEPSARIYPLPPDEFVLWREDGRLVLAVTRGSDLVHFQALGDGQPTETVLQELQCIRLQLEATGIIEHLRGITLWGEFTPAEISIAGDAMELPAHSAPLPAPLLQVRDLDLVPTTVREARHAAVQGERKKMVIMVLACLYFLFLLFLTARTAWYFVQSRRIEGELDGNAALVDDIKATSHEWDILAPAIDPEYYPVEQLLRCARLLPVDGVRFTLFKTTGDKIFIQGEAKSSAAAFKFWEDLKLSKELNEYEWKMPQPRLLINNNAEFQIEGVKYGAAK